MKIKVLLSTLAAAAALAFAQPSSAAGIKVGVLTCHVASGWGFVFGSSKDLHCVFKPVSGPAAHYHGTIDKFGVDIGYTEAGVIVWAVLAPSANMDAGALSGAYVGATAQATAGVGLGANALLGGFNKSVTLQPISIEGATGLNVAAGIGAMTLHHNP